MSLVTILTPAYNRAYSLPRLYQSLKAQTDRDFEWLVVDDGSVDDTQGLIQGYIAENAFPIRYIRKENGGKHDALNVGIAAIDSAWTFIVDSDDWLTENAVERIRFYADRIPGYDARREISALCFLRAYPDGKTNGERPRDNEVVGNFIDRRINSHDELADKAEVYLTEVLKACPFPVYPGERFLQENIVWIRIAFDYDMLFLNEAIYIGDYLADGLTRNVRKNKLRNPVGMYENAALLMDSRFVGIVRVKGALLYDIYYKIAHGSMLRGIPHSPNRLLTAAGLPAAYLIYWYYMVRYGRLLKD